MRLQQNKGVELKTPPNIRVLGLPGATLLALTISISPQLLAETPIVIGPPTSEAVIGWVGPNNGNWSQAANWHTGVVPGQLEFAENVDLFDFDTVVNLGTYNLKKLTGSGRLTLTSSALYFAANSQLGELWQTGGLIEGAGDLTVLGDANFFRARHAGSGTTVLQGNTRIDGSEQLTTPYVGGFFLDDGRRLRNENVLTWSGGPMNLNYKGGLVGAVVGSGVFENAVGAQFIATGDRTTSIFATDNSTSLSGDDGLDAQFLNDGVFRKTGSSADHITTIDVNFVNTGTVNVETGVLNFTRSGDFRGVFELAQATELRLSEGEYDFNGFESTGNGKISITGDSPFLISNDPNILKQNPPTVVNVNSDDSVVNHLDLQNGIIDSVGGSLTVSKFRQQDLSLVRGDHDLIVTSEALLVGGSHIGSGQTILKGDSHITANGITLDGGRTLVNQGYLLWDQGQIVLNRTRGLAEGVVAGGANIVNAADSGFVIRGDGAVAMSVFAASDLDGAYQTQFTNHGALIKSESTANNSTSIGVSFSNFGHVQVETGNLRFSQPFTNHGRIMVHEAAKLTVNHVDLINEDDGHLTGSGSYLLESAAKLINKGEVSPGIGFNPGFDDIGHLTVLGDYVQTDTGRLQIELAGLGAFDTLNVQGLVDLGGTLQISSLNGYTPNLGDSFILMSYLGTLGASRQSFDHIQWSGFDPSLVFDVSYANNTVKLTVSQVPLPGGLVLFASGGLMLLGFLRKNSGLQPKAAV